MARSTASSAALTASGRIGRANNLGHASRRPLTCGPPSAVAGSRPSSLPSSRSRRQRWASPSRRAAPWGPSSSPCSESHSCGEPVYLTQPPGQNSQLYVVQKGGAVRIIANDHLLARPFLDIHRLVKHNGPGGDPGMAAIAFPPDYGRTGRFYVSYNNRRDDLQVDEFSRSADNPLVADPRSRRPVLSIPEPTQAHHGGLIVFGPDGYLYLGTGDGGPAGDPAENAQNLDLLLGKLLRIDPTPNGAAPYTIPPDNPFVGRPGRDEIWAYGLRNPRRFSFDRRTKTIAIGDVGNDRYEEIDYLPIAKSRGANFGWPAFEGFAPFRGGLPRSAAIFPALAYPHHPGLRRQRRLRGPRSTARPDPRPGDRRRLHVRRLLHGEAVRLPPTARSTGAASSAASASTSATCPRSERTTRATSTCSPSGASSRAARARSTGWCPSARRSRSSGAAPARGCDTP